jgi:CMP-N-acetylneuraminic acid synthetase
MKANSDRVKGKNFKDFCGKPLFRWVLDTLRAVNEIDEVVINTDAKAILLEHGLVEDGFVRIRDRKQEICGDDVSMNAVIADDVESIEASIYLMTHVTNPLLTADTIRAALKRFKREQKLGACDSLFTVNRVQTRFYRGDGSPINHDPKKLIPTQDIEPWFEENSNIYIFTHRSFEKANARIGLNPIMYEMNPLESIDIDTQSDCSFAMVAARLAGATKL